MIKQVYKGHEFNDLGLGRFGIVWFNRLFGMRVYNPYLGGFLTVLMLLLSSSFLSFMLWKGSGGRSGMAGCLIPLVMYLTPNWIEQMYFSYQTYLVVFGVLLTELAVFLTEYGRQKRDLILPILLALCAFSIYQAHVPLYLSLCIALVLLRCLSSETRKDIHPGKSVIRHAVVFIAALAGYFLITTLLQHWDEDTTYLSSQILWTTVPFLKIFENITISILSILTGKNEIDTLSYSVSAICCIVVFVLCLPRSESKKNYALFVPGWFLLQLTGFAMILVLGTRGYIRTELSLPFVAAFNFLFAFLLVNETYGRKFFAGRLLSLAVLAACAFSFSVAAGICFRLIYTDDIRYANDLRFAGTLISRIENAGMDHKNKPVVFVGSPDIELDASCMHGEAIGQSFFQYFSSDSMTYTLITDFLHTQGFVFPPPRPDHIMEANHVASSMPDYPAEGSIKETDRSIVVRFSEGYYFPLNFLRAAFFPSDETVEYAEDDMICRIQHIATDGRSVRLEGFNFRRGTDARELKNTVYLSDKSTGQLYIVNTARKQNMFMTKAYWQDGVQYDGAGFVADLPISLFVQHPESDFDILVKCEENGKSFFVSTGESINNSVIEKLKAVSFEERPDN